MQKENITTNQEPSLENKIKKQLTTVTPFSRYLALILFIALPFIGFWLGMQYGQQKEQSIMLEEDNNIPKSNSPVSETQTNTSQADDIITKYLSPSKEGDGFYVQYSGLTTAEIEQINNIISIARTKISYNKEEQRAASDIYLELFVNQINDREQDAPSSRANMLLGTKLCIARAIILSKESEAVSDCSGKDTFPSDLDWSTDDITAIAQIAPYYIAGIHYLNLDGGRERSRYYFEQIIHHQEFAIEQWGQEYLEEVAGENYLDMVKEANSKLRVLDNQ